MISLKQNVMYFGHTSILASVCNMTSIIRKKMILQIGIPISLIFTMAVFKPYSDSLKLCCVSLYPLQTHSSNIWLAYHQKFFTACYIMTGPYDKANHQGYKYVMSYPAWDVLLSMLQIHWKVSLNILSTKSALGNARLNKIRMQFSFTISSLSTKFLKLN